MVGPRRTLPANGANFTNKSTVSITIEYGHITYSGSPTAMTDFTSIIQSFGLAVSILVFLGWCAVKAAPWMASRIDTLVARAFQKLDDVDVFADRLLQLETRIETLWDFQLRRAAVEAVQRGVATVNSPLKFSAEAKSWLGDMADELRSYYRQFGAGLSRTRLAEEIERRWGRRIVDEVCVPHGLLQGACLLLAMEVASEGAEGVIREDATDGGNPANEPRRPVGRRASS